MQLVSQLFLFLLLPPVSSVVMLLSGLIILNRHKRTAVGLILVAALTLLLLSLPHVANSIIRATEIATPLGPEQIKVIASQDAPRPVIVVLSDGRKVSAPEFDKIDTVNASTLQRIFYASWLHKKTRAPILLSGGSLPNQATPEAVLMNQIMVAEFNVQPQWIETNSTHLNESAQNIWQILSRFDSIQIILVTHAMNMPAAKITFENQGFKVIEAPVGFIQQTIVTDTWRDNIPSMNALHMSTLATRHYFEGVWASVSY